MKIRLERGLQGFENKGDLSIIDDLKAETEEMIWREKLCWQCARPQVNDFSPYCSDKCKQRAAIEKDEDKGRLEQGLQGFEHRGDVSMIDNLKAEAEEMVQRESKLKLWAKFINHQYAAWVALFELITGFKPPKMKEVAAIISGH